MGLWTKKSPDSFRVSQLRNLSETLGSAGGGGVRPERWSPTVKKELLPPSLPPFPQPLPQNRSPGLSFFTLKAGRAEGECMGMGEMGDKEQGRGVLLISNINSGVGWGGGLHFNSLRQHPDLALPLAPGGRKTAGLGWGARMAHSFLSSATL